MDDTKLFGNDHSKSFLSCHCNNLFLDRQISFVRDQARAWSRTCKFVLKSNLRKEAPESNQETEPHAQAVCKQESRNKEVFNRLNFVILQPSCSA